jgi:hypothetical protein
VTCAVEEPIRRTVSCAWVADEDVDPAVVEPPELQPAIARAAAAPSAAIAAGVFLSPTAGSPSGGPGGCEVVNSGSEYGRSRWERNYQETFL